MTLNHIEASTTYESFIAKRYTHKGSTTFFGKNFEVMAVATIYQLPAGFTRGAGADQQKRSSATSQRSRRYNTLPVPYGPTPRFIYGGKPKGVKGRY